MLRTSCIYPKRSSLPVIASLALLPIFSIPQLNAQLPAVPPTLTKIDPSRRTDLTQNTVMVTLTGTGFDNTMHLGFSPAGTVISAPDLTVASSTSAQATLRLDPNTTAETVNIWVIAPDGTTSGFLSFATGIATSICLDALQTGVCALLWEVEATSATGSSSQSNNNTTPNILVKLDYQWHPPKNRQQKHLLANRLLESQSLYPSCQVRQTSRGRAVGSKGESSTCEAANRDLAAAGLLNSLTDYLTGHAQFQTGYTQVVTTTNIQPTSGNTCPGGAETSTGSCTAAIPQDAYIADLAGNLGVSTGVNGQGTFAEFGFAARGSFQYLIPNNKIVQNGGLTYVDLSSANPQNAVGFYEATAHFRLTQLGHDVTLPDAGTQNVSNLLMFDAGYQNNRGLQSLAANAQTNTRNRYVARFSVNPEIPGTNHTTATMGMEYSGGINGGPHVIQLFFGTTLNPPKLFGK